MSALWIFLCKFGEILLPECLKLGERVPSSSSPEGAEGFSETEGSIRCMYCFVALSLDIGLPDLFCWLRIEGRQLGVIHDGELT
jgi:hypothetical protein